jgi:predicted DNA-binding ribbon-helix-helix protein
VKSNRNNPIKVVQYKGKRRSLRLEEKFWEALGNIAVRRKMRIGKLVDEVAGRKEDGQSLASALRVECLLDAERQLASTRLVKNSLKTDLIDSAPSPCIFLSENAVVLGGNRAFYKLFSGERENELLGHRFTDLFRVQTSITFNDFWINLQKRPRRPLTAHVFFLNSKSVGAAQATFLAELNNQNQFIGATAWLAVSTSRSQGR